MTAFSKKLFVFCILFCVTVVVGVKARYCGPAECIEVLSMESGDGSHIDVYINLKVEQHLLKPSKIVGTITLDGKKYISLKSENKGMLDRLKMKIDGSYELPVFVNKAYLGTVKDLMFVEEIDFYFNNGKAFLEQLVLLTSNDSVKIWYMVD